VANVPVQRPRLTVRLYHTATGRQVFKEDLDSLGAGPRAEILQAMARRRLGQQFHREDELVRDRIRAVRATYEGSEYRALYALVGRHDEVFLALHLINKKSRKLPARAIKLAENRLADWEARGQTRKRAGAP
jgi:phage-related protein